MLVPIIAWIFTLICLALAVVFIVRAYRGWKRLQNDEEIRRIIAMQEAMNFAKETAAKQGDTPGETPKKPYYKIENTDLPEIPDEIPDR